MEFQFGSGIVKQGAMDVGYNNYNSSGIREDTFYPKENEGVYDIRQIPPGKAFRGEVTDVQGNQVSIRLDNGQTVQARIAEPMSFNIGDKIVFQVKSNSDNIIEIKPIMNALQGQESTILKALEAAKLPVNEKTVVLLQSLLEAKQPIDKNSLQQMYKRMLSNSGTNVRTLVEMNKLHIPITKENIGQFEAYKNYEHRLSAAAEQLSGQLTELLGEVSGEDGAKGRAFHLQLLQLFTDRSVQTGDMSAAGKPFEEGLLLEVEKKQEENISSNTATYAQPSIGQTEGESKEAGHLASVPGASQEEPSNSFKPDEIGSVLSQQERKQLLNQLEELPLSEKGKEQLASGKGEIQNLLKELYHLQQQNPKLELGEFLESRQYHKLLKSQIQSQWFVRPEQLTSGKEMEEFYKKLWGQTRQLESILQASGQESSAAGKTTQGIKENIDFMNQINQMFTYVQLPLMMSGKTAHSDLYVFTKKKNLREQEGRVRALLHLDMEVLGSLDVYLELDGERLDTQFKVADEQLEELFVNHMDMLKQRLTEKGYQFRFSVEVTQKQVNFVDDFLAKDHGNTPMQRFAFDVRA